MYIDPFNLVNEEDFSGLFLVLKTCRNGNICMFRALDQGLDCIGINPLKVSKVREFKGLKEDLRFDSGGLSKKFRYPKFSSTRTVSDSAKSSGTQKLRYLLLFWDKFLKGLSWNYAALNLYVNCFSHEQSFPRRSWMKIYHWFENPTLFGYFRAWPEKFKFGADRAFELWHTPRNKNNYSLTNFILLS